jgi:hypothetical protein
MSFPVADRYRIDQLIRPIANLYRISLADERGEATQPVAYVRQKRLRIREDIRFYADESQTQELFAIKSRTVFEFGGVHDVVEADGTRIGTLRKEFARSLLRSSWSVLDPQEQVIMTAQERSLPLAIIRRIWGLIPYVGDVPFFIPFHFDFFADGEQVGSLHRPPGFADRYRLDVAGIPSERLDSRLAVAFAVGLDALQDR